MKLSTFRAVRITNDTTSNDWSGQSLIFLKRIFVLLLLKQTPNRSSPPWGCFIFMMSKTCSILSQLKNWVVVSNIFFIFRPYYGEDSHFDDIIFFRWVVVTTKQKIAGPWTHDLLRRLKLWILKVVFCEEPQIDISTSTGKFLQLEKNCRKLLGAPIKTCFFPEKQYLGSDICLQKGGDFLKSMI